MRQESTSSTTLPKKQSPKDLLLGLVVIVVVIVVGLVELRSCVFSSVSVEIPARINPAGMVRGVVVQEAYVETRPSSDIVHVRVRLTNTTTTTLLSADVVLTLSDSNGKVLTSLVTRGAKSGRGPIDPGVSAWVAADLYMGTVQRVPSFFADAQVAIPSVNWR